MNMSNPFYHLLGEAVFAVQELESGLSYSLALKIQKPKERFEGDKHLKKYRKYTLGQFIKESKRKKIYSDTILNNLEEFLDERNWLIHSCVFDLIDTSKPAETPGGYLYDQKIFLRMKEIIKECVKINILIRDDLIAFAEKNGKDMSRVHQFIE
jgi:hypothetical protein